VGKANHVCRVRNKALENTCSSNWSSAAALHCVLFCRAGVCKPLLHHFEISLCYGTSSSGRGPVASPASPPLKAFSSCIMAVKGKAIPVTVHEGSYGCETSRLPHFLDSRLTDGDEVVSPTRRPPFTPRKIPDTHFC
jgi:hypothetical protein